MENSNTTAQKAALWVALVFLLGAALGSMGGYVFAHHKFAVTNAASGVRPINESERRAQKLQELVNLANLTPEQTRQVNAIIGDMLGKIKAVRKTTEPQLNELRKSGQDRILAVLTEEQKPKFEEFIRRMDEERKRAGM